MTKSTTACLSACLVAALLGCATIRHSEPRLEFIPGRSGTPDDDCAAVRWTDPWGRTSETCLDGDDGIPIHRSDIYGLRIHDREVGESTWYFVSAHLRGELLDRIWDDVGAMISRPYAFSIDGSVRFVAPTGVLLSPTPIAVVRELGEAEAIAYAWDAPVERRLSFEIDESDTYAVSMVHLLANPGPLLGRKVQVHGFLSETMNLFLSEAHANALDWSSSITVSDPSDDGAVTQSHCPGHWVVVEAYLDTMDGSPVLTRLASLRPTTDQLGPQCWPLATDKAIEQ